MMRDVERMMSKGKLRKQAMNKQQKLQMMRARHSLKKTELDDALKVIDMLKGSTLVDNNAVIQDLVKFDGLRNWRMRTAGQQIPFNTLDCFYESLLFSRLRNNNHVIEHLDKQLNEVKPLLYAVIKLTLTLHQESDFDNDSHLFTNLDDFIKHDQSQKLLVPLLPGIYKPVEMIARLYVQQNIQYPKQSEYWLDYAIMLAE